MRKILITLLIIVFCLPLKASAFIIFEDEQGNGLLDVDGEEYAFDLGTGLFGEAEKIVIGYYKTMTAHGSALVELYECPTSTPADITDDCDVTTVGQSGAMSDISSTEYTEYEIGASTYTWDDEIFYFVLVTYDEAGTEDLELSGYIRVENEDVAGYEISFKDPPHTEDMYTPEFNAFAIDITHPAGLDLDDPNELRLEISYGSYLPEFTTGDRSATPTSDESDTYTLSVSKSDLQSNGENLAFAQLFHDGDLVSTDIWHYIIEEGEEVGAYPRNLRIDPEDVASEACDFGGGIIANVSGPFCRTFVALFYPAGEAGTGPEYFTGKIDETKETLFEQAPFAYFVEVEETISEIDTTEDTDDLAINLPSPFGESEGAINLTVFDDDNPLMPLLEDIRPWIITGLWLSFATYLTFRVFALFRPV